MLQVKTPEEVLALIQKEFHPIGDAAETVPFTEASGRVLAEDITAEEYVPGFDRSTVDGYACRASDTFGCSEAIPAVLNRNAEVLMGQGADFTLPRYSCAYVPTGGAIPQGADCVVMLEFTEDYGDGTVGIMKAGAPGMNMIFLGDDVSPGKVILKAGRVITPQDTGALAAIGRINVPVVRKPRVGIISTGDELVPPEQAPGPGQVRDVNSALLAAMLTGYGANPVNYGIVIDDEDLLREKAAAALAECDAVILSGGSSVGIKDAACRIISDMGTLLFHGIALKPGKPTILGKAGNKPLIGLPGHPAAASIVTQLFVLPLIGRLMGRTELLCPVTAELTENISSNHGRAQVNACRIVISEDGIKAEPIRSKSGLITQLAGADGYFIIDRDCEGLPKGAKVGVYLYQE